MRAVTDDSAYRVQFLVRGFRGVWLPAAPATVWAAGIAAAFVAVPAAFDAWGIVTQRVAPGAVGVVFAAVLAVVTAVPALMVAGAVVSRLHSPTTPFPGHYVRVLRDELRAPRPHAGTAGEREKGAFRARHPSPRPSRPGGKGASRPLSSRVQPAGRFASLSAPMT